VNNQFTIHCSDTPDDREVDIADITRWHKERGFATIGYHFVIKRSGKIQSGRPVLDLGAHVEHHNKDNIGICLVGRHKFTLAQFRSLEWLIDSLLGDVLKVPREAIFTHNYYNPNKSCPNIPMEALRTWYRDKDWEAISAYTE
jgi:N-acetylmuramoyl-L-alanine amidase